MTSALSSLARVDEGVGADVAAEVGDLVAVGLEVGDDDGLADVVHVALDGADDHDALGLRGLALEGGVGDLGGAGHGVRAHHELGEEDLAALEEVADLLDAFDEAVLHDVGRSDAGVERALRDLLGARPVGVHDALGCFLVDVCHDPGLLPTLFTTVSARLGMAGAEARAMKPQAGEEWAATPARTLPRALPLHVPGSISAMCADDHKCTCSNKVQRRRRARRPSGRVARRPMLASGA